MRIRWRGLELPSRVVRDNAVSTNDYGRFVVEPFEQGFGTTIGNSLRRVLLSSIEGAAVTTVKIAGVSHEFTTIEGVRDDVADILLNIKGIVLKMDGAEAKTMRLQRNKAGDVLAGQIETDPAVTIADPDHRIATLTSNVDFNVEMTVHTGRGYATANDNRSAEQELGVIPIDSIYSPVTRVRYRTEAMRVGQKTNYDRLILEIWTKGTMLPEDALVEAGLILRKHLNPFVLYDDLGSDRVAEPQYSTFSGPPAVMDPSKEELLDKSISMLKLSVRASNCLEAARVSTIRDLVRKTESDLIRFRSFGKTSLHEVQQKLSEVGLSLGMKVPGVDGEEGEDGDDASDQNSGPMEVYTMGD